MVVGCSDGNNDAQTECFILVMDIAMLGMNIVY